MEDLSTASGNTRTDYGSALLEETQKAPTAGLTHTTTLTVRRLGKIGKALYRFKLQIRSLRRPIYKPFGIAASAFRLDDTHVIKAGNGIRLTEAITMEFIQKNTSIPVPRVFEVFEYKGAIHIVEEYVDGEPLHRVWHTLDLAARRQCMEQLKGYIDELRSLSPPHPGKVEAVDGTHILDHKNWDGGMGPFETIDDFNNFLGYDIFASDPIRYPEIQEPLQRIKGRKWRTVFSHGDLGPHNILWKDGRIVSIIDWENAGWLPEYWDYARSYFGSQRSSGWWEMFQELAVQYPDELEVEKCVPLYVTRFG